MIDNPIWIIDQTESDKFCSLILSLARTQDLLPELTTKVSYKALSFLNPNKEKECTWLNYHAFKNAEKQEYQEIKEVADQFFTMNKEYSFRSDIVEKNSKESFRPSLYFDIHVVLDFEKSTHQLINSLVELKNKFLESGSNKLSIWTEETRFYFHVLMPLQTNASKPADPHLLDRIQKMQLEKELGDKLEAVFVYSSDNDEAYKEDSCSKIFLSIIGLSGQKKRFIDNHFEAYNGLTFQTESAGVFLEDDVYKEKQAFILSKLISGTLYENDGAFKNENKATEKLNDISLQELEGNQLINKLQSKKNLFADLKKVVINDDSNGWIKYWNQPKNQLKLYFKGFLAKLKFNLINQVSGLLEDEYKDYEKKALRQKEINIQTISTNLDKEIFKNLDNKQYNTLNQCYAVAEKLYDRVREEYVEDKKPRTKEDQLIKIFKNGGPPLDQLDTDKIVEAKNQLLREISTLVKDHPIIFWAALSRVAIVALLLCVLSNYLGTPIVAIFNLGLENYPWIPGLLVSFLPIFLVFKNQYKRTKNIHERIEKYIALSIDELNQRVEKLNIRHIQETRNAVLAYLEWVRDDKINKRLIDGIKDATFEPKEFAFSIKSKVNIPALQPIYDLPIDSNKTGVFVMPKSKSADFSVARNNPILKKDLLEKMSPIVEINNRNVSFTDLFDDNSSLINILPEYYKFEVEVDKVYQDAVIVKEEPKKYLLVLDVSGSMAEEIDFKNMRKSKYEALKTTLMDLANHTNSLELQFIAFSTDARMVKDLNNLPKPNGVTNLPSAFDLMKTKVAEFDKVILVSDGQPTDSTGLILPDNAKLNLQKIAFGLGKPLDVIYIGENQNDGVDFMQRLAAITGGNYFAENIDRLKNCIEERFKIFYQVEDKKRKLPIRKLLESGNKEACIFGLFAFCKSKVEKTSLTLEKCIRDMLDSNDYDGYKTFLKSSSNFSELNISSVKAKSFNISNLRDTIEGKMENKIESSLEVEFLEFMNEYKSIHSVIGLRQIKQISDLQLNPDWGITFETQKNN
jgi:hypothetical protein